MELSKHPINNIHWIATKDLDANHYNPNVVQNSELNLLRVSLLEQGWIQPILANPARIIIDGFHRYWLTKNDKKVKALTDGKVPVAFLDVSEREAMIITIRMNRAKGNHLAFKMHEIITELLQGGMSKKDLASAIGASSKEIDLLQQEDVFKKLDVANKSYSKAWVPRP